MTNPDSSASTASRTLSLVAFLMILAIFAIGTRSPYFVLPTLLVVVAVVLAAGVSWRMDREHSLGRWLGIGRAAGQRPTYAALLFWDVAMLALVIIEPGWTRHFHGWEADTAACIFAIVAVGLLLLHSRRPRGVEHVTLVVVETFLVVTATLLGIAVAAHSAVEAGRGERALLIILAAVIGTGFVLSRIDRMMASKTADGVTVSGRDGAFVVVAEHPDGRLELAPGGPTSVR